MTIPDSLLEAARDAYDNHDDADDACQPEALRAALEAVYGRVVEAGMSAAADVVAGPKVRQEINRSIQKAEAAGVRRARDNVSDLLAGVDTRGLLATLMITGIGVGIHTHLTRLAEAIERGTLAKAKDVSGS